MSPFPHQRLVFGQERGVERPARADDQSIERIAVVGRVDPVVAMKAE
jgi:hypothetical protein